MKDEKFEVLWRSCALEGNGLDFLVELIMHVSIQQEFRGHTRGVVGGFCQSVPVGGGGIGRVLNPAW